MFPLRMFARLVIISMLLYLCSSLRHETLTRTFETSKRLILSESSFDNRTLFYASCSRPPKQCIIVQDIDPFANSSTTRQCDVALQADNVQLVIGFGMDKAIVVTQESEQESTILKLTLVHMPSCTLTDAEMFEVPTTWTGVQMYRRNMDVVVFEDGFEVIVKGFSQICGVPEANAYCSFEFNSDGKRIEGPVVWPKTPYKVTNISSPIVPDTLKRGYFFIDQNVTLTGLRINKDGGPTYIKLWGPMDFHGHYWSVDYSVANDAYGMCLSEAFTVRCWQHTLRDGHTMKKEFTINHQHETWNIYVHNLREGGFIVLMINCPNRICSGTEDQYYFMKIDADGKMMGHFIDVKFRSDCNSKNGDILAKVFENEQGLYCAARLCKSQPQQKGKLEMEVHCYSDDHFSK